MQQRILLVNPWVHDFAAFDLWVKPLGLLYIGAVLKHYGYEVSLIDCLDRSYQATIPLKCSVPVVPEADPPWRTCLARPSIVRHEVARYTGKQRPYGCGQFFSQEIEKPPFFKSIPRRFKRYGIPPEVLKAQLENTPKPSLIAVTSLMTYWYTGVFETIRVVKSVFPSVPVVLGGIYATLCYEHAKALSGADYVVRGPGELAVLRLALLTLKPLNQVQGQGQGTEGLADELLKGRASPPKAESPPVSLEGGYAPGHAKGGCASGAHDSTPTIASPLTMTEEGPFPAYELYPRLDSVSMLTSRGCPFRCTYCASHLLGPVFKRRSPHRVVEEIEYYVNTLGVKDIAFYDDALLVDPGAHIIPILKLLIEKDIQAHLHTPNGLHPRYIDPTLARMLWRAGFKTLRLGFESSSPSRQRDSSNKVNNEELKKAIFNLKAAGYDPKDIGVYLLIGLPDQSQEEVLEGMHLVHSLGARIKLAEYSPIPGTQEFQKAVKRRPEIEQEPLTHNRVAFPLSDAPEGYRAWERLKTKARFLNSLLGSQSTPQEIVPLET